MSRGRPITKYGLFVRDELVRDPEQPNRAIAQRVMNHFPEMRGQYGKLKQMIANRRYLDNKKRRALNDSE